VSNLKRIFSPLIVLAFGTTFSLAQVISQQPAKQKTATFGVPHFEIAPNPAFVDQRIKISLRSFLVSQQVTVQLSETDQMGQVWQSHAEFLTDRNGNVNLAVQAPISGTYRRADAEGLFWSLSIVTGTNAAALKLHHASLKPIHLTLTALMNDRTVATATVERFFLFPGIKRIVVHDKGLRGILFLPSGKGHHPGIIVLGGSEGGLQETEAAFLAAKGYAAFALAYFNYEDLPKFLENIPLEYFQTAIHWLQARPEIKRNEIAVLGGSRGAELALLLGATFPEIHAVVAIAPSCVLWGGLSDDNTIVQPAWTYNEKPLSFMDATLTSEQQKQIANLSPTNSDFSVSWFQILLENKTAVAKAVIPVEKINGPVLLISGNDDKLWPSTEMADMVMKRLKHAKHPFHDSHLAYARVGHFIPLPNWPTTINVVVHPITKEKIFFGGEPEQTAAAANDSWAQIIHFLNINLSK
jgi:dienelactone hydrolase